MADLIANDEFFPASVDQAGRVQLPVELRRPLNITRGCQLAWIRDAHGLRLQTLDDTIREIQEHFTSLSPPEDVWSETLFSRRRQEAEIETLNTSGGTHD